MGNPIVHFEVNGPEPEAAAKFYAELFGWHTTTVPGDYVLIDSHGGSGINGGIGDLEDAGTPNVRIYAEADDLQSLLDRAEQLGGRTTVPIREIPEMVTYAVFADPAGNEVGLVLAGEGPGVSEGENPPVDWFEILGPDPKALWSFYQQLLGWEIKDVSMEGFTYGEARTGTDRGIAGGIGGSQDGQPHLNVYAQVNDVQAFLDRAESLGGKTILPATKMSSGLVFAQVQDPQGTWFGLYSRT